MRCNRGCGKPGLLQRGFNGGLAAGEYRNGGSGSKRLLGFCPLSPDPSPARGEGRLLSGLHSRKAREKVRSTPSPSRGTGAEGGEMGGLGLPPTTPPARPIETRKTRIDESRRIFCRSPTAVLSLQPGSADRAASHREPTFCPYFSFW